MASKPSLALKRRFKASPAQLFQAWTQPEKMIRWWGVTGHPKTPIAEADLKVGGRFRVQFHTPDGERHSVSGVYREVVPNRKLVFSWAWQSTPERESQVTIDLNPITAGTAPSRWRICTQSLSWRIGTTTSIPACESRRTTAMLRQSSSSLA